MDFEIWILNIYYTKIAKFNDNANDAFQLYIYMNNSNARKLAINKEY